jgi:hypothetical protein
LIIEARFLRGYNRDLAVKAAYQLMTHISRLSIHARSPMARTVDFFGSSGFYFFPT